MTKIDAKTVEALANYYEHPGYTPDSRMLHTAATLRALRDALDEAQGALEESLDWMDSLRASGDAGFWDWSEGDAYYRGRDALDKINEKADE